MCSFNVVVSDNEAPIVSCPSDVFVNTGAGACNAAATFASPTVSDNCDTLTASCDANSGDVFSLGSTTVSCSATDVSGNTGETRTNIHTNTLLKIVCRFVYVHCYCDRQ